MTAQLVTNAFVGGQCGDGVLLLFAQDRTDCAETSIGQGRGKSDAFDYVERFYNPKRRRSTGNLGSMNFEESRLRLAHSQRNWTQAIQYNSSPDANLTTVDKRNEPLHFDLSKCPDFN
jgi:hypothetical protein